MGILNQQEIEEMTDAQRAARQLKIQAKNTYQIIVSAFNQGSQNFWDNPRAKPSEIVAALGTDAKEIFELHGKLGALISLIKPEDILPGTSLIGQFSYNQDGTVSVVDPPEEEEVQVSVVL